MTFNLSFRWYDFWVGAYIDMKGKAVYVCPLPMIVIAAHWGGNLYKAINDALEDTGEDVEEMLEQARLLEIKKNKVSHGEKKHWPSNWHPARR